MVTYTIQSHGGKEYDIEGPEGATAEQLGDVVRQKTAKVGAEPYDVPAGVKSLMNVGQAVSFGFGDEIAGAIGGDKERYHSTVNQFRNEYPGSAALGTVAGSMLLPFGAGKAFAASPWLAAATTGGIAGALQGAGDSKTMRDAPFDASRGLIFGTLGGPALMAAGKGGAVPAANWIGSKIPGVKNWLAESMARRRVANAFERDSTNATEVGARMQDMGAEARFADGAGENTRSLLDLNASLPGKTQNKLENVIRNRIATRPDRMDDVVYAVNGGMGRAKSLEAALTAQQKGTSAPLYKQAHSMDINPSPALIRDLEAAKKLGAFSEAEKRALANPDIGPFSLGASQQSLGGGRVAVRDIDHVKRGIDTLIDKETDDVTGKVSSYGRDLVILKKRILAEVDAATTDPKTGESVFKAARAAFSGPESLKTAIKKGKAFWHEDAGRLDDIVSDMSDAERQSFMVGAAEALRTKVGSQAGQNQLLNVWKDRNVREKLQALMGTNVSYSKVEKMLNGEMTMKRLEGLGASRNSRTAVREAGNEDQAIGLLDDAAALGASAKHGPLAALYQGVKTGHSRMSTPEPVRDAIGDVLLRQYASPEIKALMKAQEAMNRYRSFGSASAGVAAGKNPFDPTK